MSHDASSLLKHNHGSNSKGNVEKYRLGLIFWFKSAFFQVCFIVKILLWGEIQPSVIGATMCRLPGRMKGRPQHLPLLRIVGSVQLYGQSRLPSGPTQPSFKKKKRGAPLSSAETLPCTEVNEEEGGSEHPLPQKKLWRQVGNGQKISL